MKTIHDVIAWLDGRKDYYTLAYVNCYLYFVEGQWNKTFEIKMVVLIVWIIDPKWWSSIRTFANNTASSTRPC